MPDDVASGKPLWGLPPHRVALKKEEPQMSRKEELDNKLEDYLNEVPKDRARFDAKITSMFNKFLSELGLVKKDAAEEKVYVREQFKGVNARISHVEEKVASYHPPQPITPEVIEDYDPELTPGGGIKVERFRWDMVMKQLSLQAEKIKEQEEERKSAIDREAGAKDALVQLEVKNEKGRKRNLYIIAIGTPIFTIAVAVVTWLIHLSVAVPAMAH
jgi:hypothetical protein